MQFDNPIDLNKIKALNSDHVSNFELQKTDFLGKIDSELTSFLDEDNKKSALNLIKQVLNSSGEDIVKMINETNKKR